MHKVSPMMRVRFELLLALFAALAVVLPAQAQDPLKISVPEGTESATPVAVVPFAFEGAGLPPETDVADVIRGDLARSGQNRIPHIGVERGIPLA